MHFYEFNISDYRRDTSYLSPLEHGVYRMLLDSYYTDELPLEADDEKLMRTHCCRSAEERAAYKTVITDFFELRDGRYYHAGCDKVLAKIYGKSDQARDAANKRWEKFRAEQSEKQVLNDAPALPAQSERNANGMLPNIPNIPIPPKSPKGKTSAIEIKTYITDCKAQGVKTIPPDDPVFEYAISVGIPEDFLRLAWLEFRDRMIDSGKRYKDWRAAFRKYVRSGYLKLWWVNSDGKYELTTAGKQAEQQHRSKQ